MKTSSAEKYKDRHGFYDLPIGIKFIYKGKKYKIVDKADCPNCALFGNCKNLKINCSAISRKDKKHTALKKI